MINTKKRVFSIVLLTIFLFVLGLGFFAFSFPNSQDLSVKADSISTDYTFEGSNLLVCCTSVYSGVAYSFTDFGSFGFDISKVNGNLTLGVHGGMIFRASQNAVSSYYTFNDSMVLTSSSGGFNVPIGYQNYVIPFYYSCTNLNDFSGNLSSVRIYSELRNSTEYWTFIVYSDVNGNSLTIGIDAHSDTSYPMAFAYEDRTYFFNANYPEDYSSGYDAGYNIGYQGGLSDNQQNIYNDGFSAGQTNGYNTGYQDGVLNSNDYSFLGLFGAVIDTPVQAFNGLFDFNVLGVNLKTFILGLLTFAILLTIIKWTKGGR